MSIWHNTQRLSCNEPINEEQVTRKMKISKPSLGTAFHRKIRKMTRTHRQLSEALRGRDIQHRNEVRFRAPNWEYGYRADIYLSRFHVVVEVDGPSHDGREWRDRVRDAKFRRDLGIRTIRIKNSDVEQNADRVARKLVRLSRYW
jgi:very-short-patch-repair endonuclease